METQKIKRTKREGKLFQQACEEIKYNCYQEGLITLRHLLKLRPHHPLYYMMLGDCYDGLFQIARALSNYKKALEYDNAFLIMDSHFHEDLLRRIDNIEPRAKIRNLVRAEKYVEAINSIDDYLRTNPNEGYPFYLRGYCNQRLKRYSSATDDYKEALKHDLPDNMKQDIEDCLKSLSKIKYKPIKTVAHLVDDKTSTLGEESKELQDKLSYIKESADKVNELLNTIGDLSDEDISQIEHVNPQLSGMLRNFRKALIQFREAVAIEAKADFLLALDEYGFHITAGKSLDEIRLEHPDTSYKGLGILRGSETGDVSYVAAALPGGRKSPVVNDLKKAKERERKRNYRKDKDNAKGMKDKQSEYYEDNKYFFRTKNRYAYLFKNHGVSKGYKFVSDEETDDSYTVDEFVPDYKPER